MTELLEEAKYLGWARSACWYLLEQFKDKGNKDHEENKKALEKTIDYLNNKINNIKRTI